MNSGWHRSYICLFFTVPGGNDGPSGVLVCSENYVTYKNFGEQQDKRCPIPRRKVKRLIITKHKFLHSKCHQYFKSCAPFSVKYQYSKVLLPNWHSGVHLVFKKCPLAFSVLVCIAFDWIYSKSSRFVSRMWDLSNCEAAGHLWIIGHLKLKSSQLMWQDSHCAQLYLFFSNGQYLTVLKLWN